MEEARQDWRESTDPEGSSAEAKGLEWWQKVISESDEEHTEEPLRDTGHEAWWNVRIGEDRFASKSNNDQRAMLEVVHKDPTLVEDRGKKISVKGFSKRAQGHYEQVADGDRIMQIRVPFPDDAV